MSEYGHCCTIKAKVKEAFGQNSTGTSKSSYELAEPQEGRTATACHASWGWGTQVRYWPAPIQLPNEANAQQVISPTMPNGYVTVLKVCLGKKPYHDQPQSLGQDRGCSVSSASPHIPRPLVEVLQRCSIFFFLQVDQMTQDTFLCYFSTRKVLTEPPCMPLQRSGNYPLIIPTANRVTKHSNRANRKKKHSFPNLSPLCLCF